MFQKTAGINCLAYQTSKITDNVSPPPNTVWEFNAFYIIQILCDFGVNCSKCERRKLKCTIVLIQIKILQQNRFQMKSGWQKNS